MGLCKPHSNQQKVAVDVLGINISKIRHICAAAKGCLHYDSLYVLKMHHQVLEVCKSYLVVGNIYDNVYEVKTISAHLKL